MRAVAAPRETPTVPFLSSILDAVTGVIGFWDRDLVCRYANKNYLEWFGKSAEAVLGRSMLSVLGEKLYEANRPHIEQALRGEAQAFERALTKADGSVGHMWVNYVPQFDDDGEVSGFTVLAADVTQLKVAEARMRDSEARYRLLADHATDMVFQLDGDGVRTYVSPASRDILGYDPEELIGARPANMIHPDDVERVEAVLGRILAGEVERDSVVNRLRHRNGDWIWVEADFRRLKHPKSGAPNGLVGALRDISARKAVETQLNEANRRLHALAHQDGLTGLANRRFLDETLAYEVDRAKRESASLALVVFDVDWFKPFNDRYGHPAGDECLRRVGAALSASALRPRDLAARSGGEEFVLVLPETDERGAAAVAERVRQNVFGMAMPHERSPKAFVTVSAGVAASAYQGGGLTPLIDLADRALYFAKTHGRNRIALGSEIEAMIPETTRNVA